MRKDMYKIICERPRLGAGRWRGLSHPYRKAKRFVLDENLEAVDLWAGLTKTGMKRSGIGWDGKSFNDYLSPLWRFIDKQVGRPWDDVYSEICENINLDSTTRRHVREHVDRHVEQNVYINEDGDPCNKARRWRGHGALSKGELYKDPIDGILKKAGVSKYHQRVNEKRRAAREERRQTERTFGEITFKFEESGERHKKYDGVTKCWFKHYHIVVDRVRIDYVTDPVTKAFVRKLIEYKERVLIRETASKSDIKKYGLNKLI